MAAAPLIADRPLWAESDMATGVFVSWGDDGSWPVERAAQDEAEVALQAEIDRVDAATEHWFDGTNPMAPLNHGWFS